MTQTNKEPRQPGPSRWDSAPGQSRSESRRQRQDAPAQRVTGSAVTGSAAAGAVSRYQAPGPAAVTAGDAVMAVRQLSD